MLIGRDDALGTLDRLLDGARVRISGALVIRGEAGIGKTAILDYAVEQASSFRVLRATGVQSEVDLPFAGLHELTRPVSDLVRRLPTAQSRALEVALRIRPGEPVDRFAVYAGTLGLLAEASEPDPLLCVIDDAHWLDAGSAEALAFAARRILREGIVILFAARNPATRVFEAAGIAELILPGLPDQAAQRVVRGVAPDLRPPVVDRLVAMAEGNPLALTELPANLTDAERKGRLPIADPVRVGARLERVFASQFATLPPEIRSALLLAAASSDEAWVTSGATGRGVRPEGFEQAERVGLINVQGGSVRFRHPLVRSAIYAAALPAERRATHRLLAARSTGVTRAWHLSAAAIGSDEIAADALATAAAEARERGAYSASASAAARAAELTAEPELGAQRLLAAAQAFVVAGDSDSATQAADRALAKSSSALLRADVQLIRARVDTIAGSLPAAYERLVSEATRIEGEDPSRAAMLLADASLAAGTSGQCSAALDAARRARELASGADDRLELGMMMLLGATLTLNGVAKEADALFAEWGDDFVWSDPIQVAWAAAPVAHMLVWREDFQRAETWAERLVRAGETGAVGLLPWALSVQVVLAYRQGDFRTASACALRAIDLAGDLGQEAILPFLQTELAWIEALRGDVSSCTTRVAEALATIERTGARSIEIQGRLALGLLAVGMHRGDEAVSALEPLIALTRSLGIGEPALAPWPPDLVEALLWTGRRDDAIAVTQALDVQARQTGRTWARAAAARCFGLLGPDAGFDEHFEVALSLHNRTRMPFERARTNLCYGERLRRARRPREARMQLRVALEVFERSGARPWADRARSELEAAGGRPRPRKEGPDELTAQELQVAMLIAGGATNREAATALFLSPKTIEFHLSNAYGKLGVRNRVQLANRMTQVSN